MSPPTTGNGLPPQEPATVHKIAVLTKGPQLKNNLLVAFGGAVYRVRVLPAQRVGGAT